MRERDVEKPFGEGPRGERHLISGVTGDEALPGETGDS